MKKKLVINIFAFCLFTILACSSYSVKTELKNNKSLSKLKRVGIVIRLSRDGGIVADEQINSINSWMGDYKSIKEISIISDCSEEVILYGSMQERFYQLSDNKRFLRYKSIGVVNLYLRKNESELRKIIEENNLDGLVIYEIYDVISAAMQYMDFDSVVVIVDKNFNIVYLDHQSNGYESREIDYTVVKNYLMDKISERFIRKLLNLKFMKK
ncbi:MAG: hypothetical protein SVZ03_08325 [Spirochaetota bacterium]|nr:hypothetical protein [Spirochaetota bacterium]